MMHEITDVYSIIFLSFITFFSTVSPINCLIIYLNLTENFTIEEKKYVKNKSTLVAFIITIVFTLIGPSGFKIIGIDLYSVKIAGGIILGVVAINMVFGNKKQLPNNQSGYKKNIAIVPLALPIISNPPTIVSSIILFSEYNNILLKIIVLLMLGLNFLIVALLFSLSDKFSKFLKKSFLNILFILTGILLTSLAAQFIISGIKDTGVFKNFSYNTNKR